jgi:drug/metabolite transporter (DMT)-like permease
VLVGMSHKRKGIMFSVLASVMFGLYPVFVKLLLNSVNVGTMNVLLTLFSTLFFVLMLVAFNGIAPLKVIATNWKKIGPIGLFTAAFALLYAYGISISGPTTAAFLLQLSTVFTIILGIVVLKERFTKAEGIGILVAVVGVFILAYGELSLAVFGTVILLFASVLSALTNLLSKVYVKNIRPVTLASGNSMFVSLFIVAYVGLFGNFQVNIASEALVFAAIGAIIGIVLSIILFYKALEVLEVSKTVTIKTMEPFLTAVFSFAILSLVPNANQLLGGVMIVIGVIVLSLCKSKEKN